MGEFGAILTGCRVAGVPTFIPGVNGSRNHTIVTVMVNRQDRKGNPHSDDVTVHFWDKSADVAANYLGVGKQCNIRGRLQSYTVDTGQVRGDGKKILHRKVEVVATRMELLGDPLKEIQAAIDANLMVLKNSGRLDPNAQISAIDILPKKSAMVAFNPTLSAQTGMYGVAKVWSKDKNHWGGNATGAPATAPTVVNTGKLADLERQIEQLKAQATAPVVNGQPGVNPF